MMQRKCESFVMDGKIELTPVNNSKCISKSAKTTSGVCSIGFSREKQIGEFLEEYGIYVNQISTDDGYFIIDKSIADIFRLAGINTCDFDYEKYVDWYITGLNCRDGSITYSLIKVREPMDKDEKNKGTAIVFKSLSISALENLIADAVKGNDLSKNEINIAKAEIDKIVYASKKSWEDYDQEILDYYKDKSSEGSYLIADFIVNKVANNDEFLDGKYVVPYKYNDFDIYGKKVLDKLSDSGVHNKKTNTISILDSQHLLNDEKQALLLITTGDPDKYAFAGENQFHAVWYEKNKNVDNEWYSYAAEHPYSAIQSPDLKLGLAEYIEKHAIASDAGVGESTKNLSTIYERLFKSEDGEYYKMQKEEHSKDK